MPAIRWSATRLSTPVKLLVVHDMNRSFTLKDRVSFKSDMIVSFRLYVETVS